MKRILQATLLIASAFIIGCDNDDSENPLNTPAEAKLIGYVSTDAQIITPTNPNGFGARILSNTYTNNIGTISFSNAVTAVGERAFWQCTTLQAITLPDRIRDIEDSAFGGCTNLSEISIPSRVTEIGDGAFAYCNNLGAFFGNIASEDNRCLIIGTTLVAFAPAGLTTYSVMEGITEIGGGAFEGCSNLIGVALPLTLTEIDERAFAYCLELSSVTVPAGVTEISVSTFEGCSALDTVVLPNTINEIETMAFNGCSALQSIYCAAVTPPRLTAGAFDQISSEAVIYVPSASVAAYKDASNWSAYASKIVGYEF